MTSTWGPCLPRDPLPPGVDQADVAIVGGGLAGLSAALEILRRDPNREVLVLEAEGLGAGASGRSTGMLTPGVGQNLPGQRRRLGDAAARDLYLLTLEAVRDAVDLIEREQIACDLNLNGQLIVARGQGGGRRLVDLWRALRGLGLPGQPLDAAGLERRIRLRPEALTPNPGDLAALHLHDAGTLDPLALVAGLAGRVEALGGTIHTGCRVTQVGDGWLELGDRRLAANHVVLAAAGLASRLGVQRGRVLPVTLQALASEPLEPEALRALGWDGREGVIDSRRLFDFFRLTTDRRIVFGGGRPGYGAAADTPSKRAVEALREAYRATFPTESTPEIARVWTGTIGVTLDEMPAIGALPGLPRTLHVGGWCGHGIALSLAAGRWVAALLAGAKVPPAPFFRSRPPLLPFAPLRRLGFEGVVSLMALSDRIA